MAQRPRILFFGEGVTLAHVGRPLALSAALPHEHYEAIVACPVAYHRWAPAGVQLLPLSSQSPEAFNARLADGRRLYTEPLLEQYVTEDLRLIGEVRPDLVVGDFRLSLAASARKASIPYISIANAYWDPDRNFRPQPPPLHGLKALPPWAGRAVFRLAWPMLMRWHAQPIASVLARHGVDIGGELRRAFTEADLSLYADFPSLHPQVAPSATRVFLGPVAWEPPAPVPPWWGDLPSDRKLAYCTLGSSGETGVLHAAVSALTGEGFAVIVSTAGRTSLPPMQHVFVADYLSGSAACARADLVLCNGGAPTTNQALAVGRPVLGLCSNMDQLLNMQAVKEAGAGLSMRSDQASVARIRGAVRELRKPGFQARAQALAEEARSLDPPWAFLSAVDRLLSDRSCASAPSGPRE